MAIPIKAIPKLYGEDAQRMMKAINEAEERFEEREKDSSAKESESFYVAMRNFLKKSDGNN